MSGLNYELLSKQDDRTSTAIISLLSESSAFQKLSEAEGEDIRRRDGEDDVKLAVGIKKSVEKGVIPEEPSISSVIHIDVVGKSSEEVADNILRLLPSTSGNVVVLQGLSGTGKGTTVKKLQEKLPQCITWSNGNVFRCLTFILSEAFTGGNFAETLTSDRVASAVKRLSFEKFEDGFDVVIDKTTRVRDIQNTVLKEPVISQRVPTVAEETQGEVITFGAAAVELLKTAGFNVILEGRAQTLNYIPTDLRFQLEIGDTVVLGQRRAAQRVMAAALKKLEKTADEKTVQAVVVEVANAM